MSVRILVFLICFILVNSFYSQDLEVKTITLLDHKVSESSGLIFLKGKLITINDSGGKAELYEIDTLSGEISRTVTVKNAKNIDWEALTYDDKFIYIGDIGNNNGNRTDLRIYKIPIQTYLSQSTVSAEKINFSYADQLIQGKNHLQTEYDAEALMSVGDSLILFSKNWKKNLCHIYTVPKESGDYTLSAIDSFATPGKICDASFNFTNGDAYLVGYGVEPFYIRWRQFGSKASLSDISHEFLLISNSLQVEGVANDGERIFYTSETLKFGSLTYQGELGSIPNGKYLGDMSCSSRKIKVQSTHDRFIFENNEDKMKSILIKNAKGNEVLHCRVKSKRFDLLRAELSTGRYKVEVLLSSGKSIEVFLVNE